MGSWHLSLRAERPVEGCEVGALAYLYQKSLKKKAGIPSEPPQPPPPPASEYELKFRWLRGPEAPLCNYAKCPVANNFSPLVWSGHARKNAVALQCVDDAMLRRMQLPQSSPAHAVFCSSGCLNNAWADRLAHSSGSDKGGDVAERAAGSGKGIHGEEAAADSRNSSDGSGSGNRKSRRADSLSSILRGISDNTENGCGQNNKGDNGDSALGAGSGWVEVCSTQAFTPKAADVGRRFRLECSAVNLDGSLLFGPRAIKLEPVLSTPPATPKRPVLAVKGASSGGGYRFRILSYNLLSEIYATQQMYGHCDFWALAWGYRLPNLLRELKDCAADVLCLQEVQHDHYERDVKPWLNEHGFDGLYKQKTREAMGRPGKVDGCAVFWRRSKFRLAEHYAVEFNACARTLAQAIAHSEDHEREILNRLMKDNVGLVTVLEVLLPGNSQQRNRQERRMGPLLVAVANTHLYSNKDFPDVKLWQCLSLIRELEQLVLARDLPLVICGDFNSVPSSAVYELLATRRVREEHPDLNEDALRVLPHTAQELSHALDLVSAYQSVAGEEPPYTNYTTGFKGVLDYIWCSQQHIRPLAVAPVPKEEALQKAGAALPNVQYSSDHIMLCADLQLGGTVNPQASHSHNHQMAQQQQQQQHQQQQLQPPPPPPPPIPPLPPPMMGATDFPHLGQTGGGGGGSGGGGGGGSGGGGSGGGGSKKQREQRR